MTTTQIYQKCIVTDRHALANITSIHCQFGYQPVHELGTRVLQGPTEVSQRRTIQTVRFHSGANPLLPLCQYSPICQSNVNLGLIRQSIHNTDTMLSKDQCQEIHNNPMPILIASVNPMSIQCQSTANPLTNPYMSWELDFYGDRPLVLTEGDFVPIEHDSSPCIPESKPIWCQSVPIHRQSYTNRLPIRCQFSANPVPIQSNQSCPAVVQTSPHLGVLLSALGE